MTKILRKCSHNDLYYFTIKIETMIGGNWMNNHEIDYKICGDDMQFVQVELDPQETVVAEAGSFMMMDGNVKMETIFGDGSSSDRWRINGQTVRCRETINNW